MTAATFVPLRELLATCDEAGLAPADGDGFLDRVGIDDLVFAEGQGSLTATLTLSFRDEIGFSVPGASALGLYLGKTGNPTTITVQVIYTSAATTIRLVNVALTLRLPAAVLKPVTLTSDGYQVKTLPDGNTASYEISLSGINLAYTPGGDFSVDAPGLAITLAPAMIGDSGVIIESDDITLHFDRNAPPPSGQLQGFQGIHIARAVVHLPKDLSVTGSSISFTDASIGSGGFSGTIDFDDPGLTWDATQEKYNGTLVGSLAGFAAGIRKIEFSFLRNVLQKGALQVEAFFPYLDKRLGIELRIANSGDFLFALSGPKSANADPDVALDKGVIHLKQPDVLEATLESIAIERQTADVAIRLSGSIRPLFGGIDWPEVGVKELTIHSDGRVSIGGGWIDLPEQKGAGLFGFPLEIRQVGFGTEADRRWVGFSGGIKLVEGLPIGGAVEGLRIKWDPENPAAFDIDLKGIAINLEIPEVITLAGRVGMYRENGKEWFQGGVKVTLHPLTCTLDAQLLVGRTPKYSFFYIFLEAALPVGIPLGCTSLALYGMGGLFGYNVRPNRHDGEPWYTGWYKRAPEGPTDSSKWIDELNSLAFGATVTLGTLSDNGMAVNARVLLILLIPGPVILIDGRANLMRDRKTLLTGDPLFKTLAVIDGQAGTVMFDIEPHYLYPESGEDRGNVIDLTGVAEGFFDFNHPERWYVNVGVRDPKEKRIRATLIKLFKATSYLMLNNRRVALGASVSIDVHYEYGPVGLALGAWFDADAELVFRPLQLTAAVGLHGLAELKAIGLGLRIELDATAQVTTPRPYTFSALLHAKADLPWPLPDVEVNIPYEYQQPRPSPVTVPLQAVNVVTLKGSEFWDTGDAGNAKLVPLDGRVVIVFAKGMYDDALIGGNSQPASSETSGDLRFDYRLTSVRLEKRVSGTWEVKAACPQAGAPRLLAGMWLPMTNDETPCAKLMLDVKNPFDGMSNTTSAYAEQFVARNSGYPGVYEISDYEAVAVGTVFNGSSTAPYMHDGLAYDAGGLVNWYGGVRVVDAAAATSIAGKVAGWPQHHALFIPARWGLVTAPGGGTTTTGSSGSGGSAPLKSLRITLPSATVAQVRLDIITVERVAVTAYDSAGTQLDSAELNLPTGGSTPRRVQLTVTGPALSYVIVDGSITFIFAVRYLSLDVTTTSGKINTHNQQDTQRWADEEILLDPNSDYRLVVETAVEARRGSANTSWPMEVDAGALGPDTLPFPTSTTGGVRYAFEYEAYFRTEGGPGFLSAEIDRQVAANSPDLPPETGTAKVPESLVRTLRPYVRRTTPADGARPVYRRYDLLVHFNESYVKRMYESDGNRSLTLALTDRNGAPPRVLSGGTVSAPQWTASQFNSTWGKQRQWLATQGEAQWVNTVADAKWLSLPANPATDDSLCVSIDGPPLGPNMGFTAMLQADPDTDAIDTELYRFSFTTSRYASFVHQIHEFDGRVWDSDQARDAPLAALTGAQQTTLENAAKSGKVSDYETLRGLFQIAQRPLPDTLEITLLHDAARKWGFLIESPEPLEVTRTSVRSRFLPHPLPAPAHAGPLRIRDVQRGDRSGADYNSEWIDLVVIEPTALAGWQLEHLQAPSATAFSAVLTFAQTDVFYPGQIVRVHAGMAPAVAPDDGIQHVYAAQSAANVQWLLNASGDTVRLLAPSSPHRSVFGMLPDWADVDCCWVWNADRTRVFVLPFHEAPGCLTALVLALPEWLRQLIGIVAAKPIPGLFVGGYRFELTYVLDASAQDSSLPILSIGGRTTPEVAVVQISTG